MAESQKSRKVLQVGTRKSELAKIQTNHVVSELKKRFAGREFGIVEKVTTGDKILDVALSKIGEKSLFTKELENSLECGEVDLVVHSLKDLPTTLPEGMVIGAILEREDPRDAVLIKSSLASKHSSLSDLPAGAVIGTSAVRRCAQIRASFPNLTIADIRGNLNTRLRKLDEGEGKYSALVLAAAGVTRMKWTDRISQLLEPECCLHAVGQGALAVECREEDAESLRVASELVHRETLLACVAERAFMRLLEGGCSAPVAAHAQVDEDGVISLDGGVWSLDGKEVRRKKISRKLNRDEAEENKNGSESEGGTLKKKASKRSSFSSVAVTDAVSWQEMESAEALGEEVARALLKEGAKEILEEAKRANSAAV